jgi:SAM-dependent methyltransferase
MAVGRMYTDGTYAANNPDWHSADSAWKAGEVERLLRDAGVAFSTCAEVGCGAGRVVGELARLIPGPRYAGYDISPDAARFWPADPPPGLVYRLSDMLDEHEFHDLVLAIDVFEHVEDFMGFLRRLRLRGRTFVFHVPLDMHVSGLLRDRQIDARYRVGHLHYFSRATALAALADCGYAVREARFTRLAHETAEGRRGAATAAANVLRSAVAAVSTELAAKVLGGYSLLVLADADPAAAAST